MSFTVLDAGFHSLLVDRGRRGSRHLGVPLGGAADSAALAIANGLVGNPPATTALEVTMLGPTLRADAPTACALFGAPFGMALANKGRLATGSTFTLDAGDVVKIAGTPMGVRAYFAVAGGFEGALILGSRSALQPISPEQVLCCSPSRMASRSLAFNALPRAMANNAVQLRALPGPQFKNFLKPESFFDKSFEVAPASDRMGLRLLGPALERRASELPSEAIAPGAVQVTNDGLPVIIGVDGQTIGGYPKIVHVIRADLDILAQLRPGTLVRFVKVSIEEADIAAEERDAVVREWLTRLSVTAVRLQ